MTQTIATQTRIEQLGAIANMLSAQAAFADYRAKIATNTRNRQDVDLAAFAEYLTDKGVTMGDLATDCDAWHGVTHGLVNGFQRELLGKGFAVSTINIKLCTIRKYCELATVAGCIHPDTMALIRGVHGDSRKQAKRLDAGREKTRIGHKKAESNVLTAEQVKQIKAVCDVGTSQGRRDYVLIGLLADYGLRVGEVVALDTDAFNAADGTLTFYREKVDMVQTHQLANGVLSTMRAYVAQDAQAGKRLMRATVKGGQIVHAGISRFAIAQRIQWLGKKIGVRNLSPHDLRHSWATRAARNNTDSFALRDAGGWTSLAMPSRYVEAAKIANSGVKLGDE